MPKLPPWVSLMPETSKTLFKQIISAPKTGLEALGRRTQKGWGNVSNLVAHGRLTSSYNQKLTEDLFRAIELRNVEDTQRVIKALEKNGIKGKALFSLKKKTDSHIHNPLSTAFMSKFGEKSGRPQPLSEAMCKLMVDHLEKLSIPEIKMILNERVGNKEQNLLELIENPNRHDTRNEEVLNEYRVKLPALTAKKASELDVQSKNVLIKATKDKLFNAIKEGNAEAFHQHVGFLNEHSIPIFALRNSKNENVLHVAFANTNKFTNNKSDIARKLVDSFNALIQEAKDNKLPADAILDVFNSQDKNKNTFVDNFIKLSNHLGDNFNQKFSDMEKIATEFENPDIWSGLMNKPGLVHELVQMKIKQKSHPVQQPRTTQEDKVVVKPLIQEGSQSVAPARENNIETVTQQVIKEPPPTPITASFNHRTSATKGSSLNGVSQSNGISQSPEEPKPPTTHKPS